MFRIVSTSRQIVDLQVVQNGILSPVRLLPKNFVFSEEYTEHMKNLALNKLVRVTEVSVPVAKNSSKVPAETSLKSGTSEIKGKNFNSKNKNS